MKLSFEGCRSNALRQLREIKYVAETSDRYDEDEHGVYAIEMCISAYHDCLLALMKGDVELDEVRDFLLYKKTPEEIAAMPYCGNIVSFKESKTDAT